MISVDHGLSGRRRRPLRPSKTWLKKAEGATKQAIAAVAAGKKPIFPKKVYAAKKIGVTLEELFNFKCAYCETSLARSDVNVEHYRPKARVSEDPAHPGYYWLAFEWTNLFPSCAHCNQLRIERSFKGRAAGRAGRGKLDHFPLLEGSHRAYGPTDNIAREKRLLLNPREDRPEEHLRYDPKGRILPLNGSSMAPVSIEIYARDTKRLDDARERRIGEVVEAIRLGRILSNSVDTLAKAQIDALLNKLISPEQPYAGAARYVYSNPDEFGV